MVLWSARVKVTSVLITPPDQSGKGEGEPGVAQCSRGVRIVQDISQSQLKRRMYISMIDVLELRSDGTYDPRRRTSHDAAFLKQTIRGRRRMQYVTRRSRIPLVT